MKDKEQSFSIPMSIVAAGFIIAAGIVIAGNMGSGNVPISPKVGDSAPAPDVNSKIEVSVDSLDHIWGDPDAPLTIVEFSDFECPFCGSFHPTMEQIVADYDGQVRWVYKHFPLSSIHPGARRKAMASECAFDQAGNDAFWQFSSDLFRSGDDIELIAQNMGLDVAIFNECVASEKFGDRIDKQYKEATIAGGQGTPFSVLIKPDGSTEPISGAVPYSTLSGLIDSVLAE